MLFLLVFCEKRWFINTDNNNTENNNSTNDRNNDNGNIGDGGNNVITDSLLFQLLLLELISRIST